MEKILISLSELLLSLSHAQDVLSPPLYNHHQQVACLSYHLAKQAKTLTIDCEHMVLAALVHDIGALAIRERLEVVENDGLGVKGHAFRGAALMDRFKPMQFASEIIKYHHLPWENGKGLLYNSTPVPVESHIIHAADRFCAMIDSSRNILSQIPDILRSMNEKNNIVFMPEAVEILCNMENMESVWLDLVSDEPFRKIHDIIGLSGVILDIDDLTDLAIVFSHIIDFRSRFTSCHSAGVASTAMVLSQLVGFSPMECKMMQVAGYLHDLGKVAIDSTLLEKPDKLTTEERDEIRGHTYFTYHMLDPIKGFEIIKQWAAFHHERLDGKGYPFHISGGSLSLGSRIMCVADVFTAITEDRPYRLGMNREDVLDTLIGMAQSGGLDNNIINTLKDNYDYINDKRIQAQQTALERYKSFINLSQ